MPRLARIEVFAPDEVAIVHVTNRVVCRCFLLGTDSFTGKNYDHRKIWVETQLQRLAACFGIDLLCFSILSNHFHLSLRSRPDVVATWTDTDVARRWLLLCPIRKDSEGVAEEPNEMELNTIRNDPRKLEIIRLRLSDISWWMRILCQNIAMRANFEDQELGKFWQSRFRAVRILDESALLACAAYVDLNPIRAAMAETLEQSDFTSVQRRIQALQQQNAAIHDEEQATPSVIPEKLKLVTPQAIHAASAPPTALAAFFADRFLSPITINEQTDPIGPVASTGGFRCSDKGFLPIPVAGYLELLDWTARQFAAGKRGSTPLDAPPIFSRLSIQPKDWCELIGNFGSLFCSVAGRPQTIDATRSRVGQHRYHIRPRVRELLASCD
jgi:hypothetical protein